VARLTPHYGPDCGVAIVYRASWPDQKVVRGTLSTIVELMGEEPLERTATILVGRVLGASDFRESALYSADYQRRFRGKP
jgi:precorrin-4/cobalt-precorrin-4 C11-methyltransferase